MNRDLLFAALKYNTITVEELTDDSGQCSVASQIERYRKEPKKDPLAILVGGRLVELDSGIGLQTTIAFRDELEWRISGGESMTTEIPPDPVVFPPRKIPETLLQQLATAQRDALKLYREPSNSSPFVSLADTVPLSFEVVDIRGNWVQVRQGARDGWIRLNTVTNGDLEGTFPELHFFDGLIGYQHLRNAQLRSSPMDDPRLLDAIRASFDRYIQATPDGIESETRALAKVLKGNATVRAAKGGPIDPGVMRNACASYEEARREAPASTIANSSYLACSVSSCAPTACVGDADRLHDQFLDAIERDPDSTELVSNIGAFYRAARTGTIELNNVSEVQLEKLETLSGKVRSDMVDFEVLPRAELFDPLLADPLEPHFSITYLWYQHDRDLGSAAIANLGETFALLGGALSGGRWELGLLAGTSSVFDLEADSNDLVMSDFRIGPTLSARSGPLSTQLRIYYQSSHLSDELLRRDSPVDRLNVSYEGIDWLVSADPFPWLRIYAGLGEIVDSEPDLHPLSVQGGLELQSPISFFANSVRPIVAFDYAAREENHWREELAGAAGVQVEIPKLSKLQVQILGDYYKGYSRNGTFFQRRIESIGIGVHLHF